MKKIRILLFPIILSLVLLMTSCTALNMLTLTEERRTINFNDIEYTRPDVETLKENIIAYTNEIENAESFEKLLETDYKLGEEYSSYITSQFYVEIQTYLDFTNEFYDEEYRFLSESSVDIQLLMIEYTTILLEGKYRDDYREYVGDYSFKQLESSLLFSNESVSEIKKERESVNSNYNDDLNELTVSYDGNDYLINEIFSDVNYPILANMYYSEYGEHYANILSELVALDKEIAKELGFPDAATMYYETYYRDYTPQEALEVCQIIKETLVPIAPHLNYNEPYMDYSLERIAEIFPTALANFDSSFVDEWNFMLEYSLYDFSESDVKANAAFLAPLPSYDTNFLFLKANGDARSFFSLVHEYGHFLDMNSNYAQGYNSSLDIAETFSYSMEFLMMDEYDLFFENSEELVEHSLSYILSGTIYQALLEEFQIRIYELDEVTFEALDELFITLMIEYGYLPPELPEGYIDSQWLAVTHIFDSPFYTFSYVASSVPAFQLYDISLEDRDKAVDLYQDLLKADQRQGYTDFLATANLKPVTDESVFYETEEMYREIFSLPKTEEYDNVA